MSIQIFKNGRCLIAMISRSKRSIFADPINEEDIWVWNNKWCILISCNSLILFEWIINCSLQPWTVLSFSFSKSLREVRAANIRETRKFVSAHPCYSSYHASWVPNFLFWQTFRTTLIVICSRYYRQEILPILFGSSKEKNMHGVANVETNFYVSKTQVTLSRHDFMVLSWTTEYRFMIKISFPILYHLRKCILSSLTFAILTHC